jgi:chromosome partitioning protein
VVNQKGGCGKTTTTVNVAACLAFLGKKVLIVDMDSQAHSTLSLGINPDELQQSMFDVLDPDNQTILLRDVAISIEEGLDLAPSQTVLSVIEQKLSGVKGRERRLQLALAPLRDVYDFVLIDCPPSIGLLTFNALCAADEVLVPVEPSFLSVHGLKKLMETIALVNEIAGREKPITVKALITLLDKRTCYANKMEAQVREMFQDKVFETPVRKNVKLQEAAEHGKSIVHFNRHSVGFEDYIAVSMEILDIKMPEQESAPAEIKSYTIHTKDVPVETFELIEETIDEDCLTEDCLTDSISINEHILFSIAAPNADVVELVADFSGWTPIPMRKDKEGEGMWKLDVALQPGVYEYKFIVDGVWMPDPDNYDTVDDTFGGVNSLVSFMRCIIT